MAKRPRAIFVAEAFAVFGIFSLYLLEFLGVETFSLLSRDVMVTQPTVLSFTSTIGNEVMLSSVTVVIMAGVLLGVLIYFGFLRNRIFVK